MRMPKREARIAREIEKRLKRDAKAARLREQLPIRGVRTGAAPNEQKQIRLGNDPTSIYGMKVTWSCKTPDVEGAWSWGTPRQWTAEEWETIIHPKFQQWEQLSWGEIDDLSSGSGHKMHHNMDTDTICDEAQYRLVEIEKYGDIIFRFRLGNKRRLWGFRTLAEFEVLWFDPKHEIYPTDPD